MVAENRLARQIDFLLDADRLKGVERRSRLADGSRRENTAEHSWHLALMAVVLSEHAQHSVDLAHVVQMLLVHDIVEIDAGDTFVYDDACRVDKVSRETIAADRLFAQLPDDQGRRFRALWNEFEANQTSDALFARALDRLQPLLLNHASGGLSWREHEITADRVYAVNESIQAGSSGLWALAQALIADAVDREMLAGARAPEPPL